MSAITYQSTTKLEVVTQKISWSHGYVTQGYWSMFYFARNRARKGGEKDELFDKKRRLTVHTQYSVTVGPTDSYTGVLAAWCQIYSRSSCTEWTAISYQSWRILVSTCQPFQSPPAQVYLDKNGGKLEWPSQAVTVRKRQCLQLPPLYHDLMSYSHFCRDQKDLVLQAYCRH